MKKLPGMGHPDIHHMENFAGRHVGTYDSKVHGVEASEEKHGMINTKGQKSCSLDEKHYAHIK